MAQQAYDNYMGQLADRIPELRQLAYQMYQDEIAGQRADLNMLNGLEQGEYGKYQDRLGQWNTDRGFAYQVGRDALSDQRYDTEYADSRADTEYARTMEKAKTLASFGDFSGFAALGYSQEEIDRMKAAYDAAQMLKASPGRSGGGGGSGGGKVTANTAQDGYGGQTPAERLAKNAMQWAAQQRLYGNYDVDPKDYISDTLGAVSGLWDTVSGTVEAVANGEDVDWKANARALDQQLDSLSKALGVPYENVVNLFSASARMVFVAKDGPYLGEYEAMKLTTDPEKNSNAYYDLLFRAMRKDNSEYRNLYGQMLQDGWDKADLAKKMESRMEKAQGVTKVSELDQRYLAPEQQDAYDKVYSAVSGSDVWRKASGEQRGKAKDDLYQLASGSKAGEKLREKIDGGASVGIDETDYILYRLALSMADQPTESGKLGSYTNDEVEAAINMLTGLSRAEKSWLWTAQGRSGKNNPWK